MAGADGNRQGIHASLLHELHRLIRIGQVLQTAAARAMTVFDPAQAADLAFHRDALGVRQFHHFTRHFDVVFEARRRLAVFHQRAVHHHAGEAHVNRALAGGHAVAVILVQYDRKIRIDFGSRDHQVIQEAILRIGTRPAARLHDHGRLGFRCRLHDRLNLFHVVDVERANSVPAFGRLVEKLPH